MNQEVLRERMTQIMGKRNFAYLMVIVSERQRVILIPENTLNRQIVFEGTDVPDDYLIDWADSVLRKLLTVNPQTVAKQIKHFIALSITSTALSKKMKDQERMIKKDKISTVFYPKEFQIFRETKKLHVRGSFLAYIGSDKNPVIAEKTYALGYRVLKNGVIAISSLEEIRNDEDN